MPEFNRVYIGSHARNCLRDIFIVSFVSTLFTRNRDEYPTHPATGYHRIITTLVTVDDVADEWRRIEYRTVTTIQLRVRRTFPNYAHSIFLISCSKLS